MWYTELGHHEEDKGIVQVLNALSTTILINTRVHPILRAHPVGHMEHENQHHPNIINDIHQWSAKENTITNDVGVGVWVIKELNR